MGLGSDSVENTVSEKPASALVTGGAGFLGRHVARALEFSGAKVTVVDDLSCRNSTFDAPELQSPGITLIEGSTLDAGLMEELVAQHQTIVHFASIVGVEKTISEPVITVENLEGTLNITRHLTSSHNVLFSSSADVYGVHSHIHDGPMGEDDLQVFEHSAINRWVYPKVKSLEENLVANSPASSAIVRVFNSYGPGMDFPHGKRVVPQFIDRLRHNQPLQISGNGRQLRSLCYYEDTVRGCLEALEHVSSGANGSVLTVNIGSDHAVEVVEIAQELVRHAVDLGLVSNPPPLEFGARLYSQDFDDSWSRTPDLGRAKAVLGFSPRVGLDDGLRRTLLYYREAFGPAAGSYTAANLQPEPVVRAL